VSSHNNSVCICYPFFAVCTNSDDDPKLNHNNVKGFLPWRPMFSPRSACGIFGGQSGNAIGSLEYSGFPISIIPPVLHTHSFFHSSIHHWHCIMLAVGNVVK
jgi:hypothetical protein